MSVCLFCGKVNTKEGKKYCSLKCWINQEKLDGSVNCMGLARSRNGHPYDKTKYLKKKKEAVKMVKKNLGEVIDDLIIDEGWGRGEGKTIIGFNSNLNPSTKQKLEQVLELCKTKRKEMM
jgi:hypothetical protein